MEEPSPDVEWTLTTITKSSLPSPGDLVSLQQSRQLVFTSQRTVNVCEEDLFTFGAGSIRYFVEVVDGNPDPVLAIRLLTAVDVKTDGGVFFHWEMSDQRHHSE